MMPVSFGKSIIDPFPSFPRFSRPARNHKGERKTACVQKKKFGKSLLSIDRQFFPYFLVEHHLRRKVYNMTLLLFHLLLSYMAIPRVKALLRSCAGCQKRLCIVALISSPVCRPAAISVVGARRFSICICHRSRSPLSPAMDGLTHVRNVGMET